MHRTRQHPSWLRTTVLIVAGVLAAGTASAQADLAPTALVSDPDPAVAGRFADLEVTVQNYGPSTDPNPHAIIYPAVGIFYDCDVCAPNGGVFYGVQMLYLGPPKDGWSVGGSVNPAECIDYVMNGTDTIDWNDWYYTECPLGEMTSGSTTSYHLSVPVLEGRPPISTEFVLAMEAPENIRHQPMLFGLPIDSWNVTGTIELVADSTGTPNEGCEALVGFTAGNIALVDRGTCEFGVKAFNAQEAGATAVVVANSTTAGYPNDQIWNNWAGGAHEDEVTIPVMMIGYNDGQALRASRTAAAIQSVFPDGDDWQFVLAGEVTQQANDPNPNNNFLFLMIDAITPLFADGFESGDMTGWDIVVGAP